MSQVPSFGNVDKIDVLGIAPRDSDMIRGGSSCAVSKVSPEESE